MRKLLSLVLVLGLLAPLGPTGCQKKVNSTNPQVIVANALLKASQTTKAISDGLVAANDFVENMKATEPQYYAAARPWLKKIATYNEKARKAIVLAGAGDTAADWKGALRDIAAQSTTFDPTVFGFKNPNSQAVARASFSALLSAISNIPTIFGGQP